MTFDYLSPEMNAILERKGIVEPTPPQKDAGPKIQKAQNVLLVAPTGIGKTEAAMLPIFDALHKSGRKPGIRCIYITPLRALNRDMMKRMKDLGSELGITVDVRHGDTSAYDRQRQSTHPPEVMITTPETIQVMFTGTRLVEHLKNVRCVVIDEIHELADNEKIGRASCRDRVFV